MSSAGGKRVVLVTGCSTGIGLATALRLAEDGDAVFATMRNTDSDGGKELRSAAARGLSVTVMALDVNSRQACARAVRDVVSTAGRIDVVVNNAGVGAPLLSAEETPEEVYRSVMETNFFAAMRLSQMCLPAMRERGSGCIINVSSIAGVCAMATQSAYCASKWALEAATEAMAVEAAPFGVRVKLVEPGVIITPILTKTKGDPVVSRQSPYVDVLRYVSKWYAAGGARKQPPAMAADVVAKASRDTSARLRYPVGEDAEAICGARRTMRDEVWADQARVASSRDNAAARRWWADNVGLDVSAGFRDRAPRKKASKL